MFKNIITSLILLFSFAPSVHSQEPTPLYLPYAPGGMTDKIGRLLTKNIDYYVVNRPGAQGQLVLNEMKKKPGPILFSSVQYLVVNPLVNKSDFSDNLEIIAILGSSINVLFCKKDLGFDSLQDLRRYSKKLSFGTGPAGGGEFLNVVALQNKINRTDIIIPYQSGGNRQFLDLLGGHVDCGFSHLAHSIEYLNDSRIKPLLITHDYKNISKTIPSWRKEFNENFILDNISVLAVDKKWPDDFKLKILQDFKKIMYTNEFQMELELLGHTVSIFYGKDAENQVAKSNKTLTDFLIKNKNILLN